MMSDTLNRCKLRMVHAECAFRWGSTEKIFLGNPETPETIAKLVDHDFPQLTQGLKLYKRNFVTSAPVYLMTVAFKAEGSRSNKYV